MAGRLGTGAGDRIGMKPEVACFSPRVIAVWEGRGKRVGVVLGVEWGECWEGKVYWRIGRWRLRRWRFDVYGELCSDVERWDFVG